MARMRRYPIRTRISTHYRVREAGRRGGGTRWVRVRTVPRLAPVMRTAQVTASAIQLRVMAEEARELLIDRLMAASPQPPGRRHKEPMPALRRSEMPFSERTPYDHEPLSEAWVKRKAREEMDGRKLIATGDYIEGIEVVKGQQRGGGVYYMVRPENRKHEPSGIALSLIARIHEYGTDEGVVPHIPARPHWRPAVHTIIRRFEQQRPTVRAVVLREALRDLEE